MIRRLWKEVMILRACLIASLAIEALVAIVVYLVIASYLQAQNVDQWWRFFENGQICRYGLTFIIFNIMAAASFSAEFHDNTMQYLLSQPISRNRIWIGKILVLFTILGAFGLGYSMGSSLLVDKLYALPDYERDDLWNLYGFYPTELMIYWGSIAIANGTLSAILLKQTHLASWCAIIAPAFVLAIFMALDNIISPHVFGKTCVDLIFSTLDPIFSALQIYDNQKHILFACFWTPPVLLLSWWRFKRLEV